LIVNKADITADDNYAIKYASYNGHLPVIKCLIENGADVTSNDDAVHWASMHGHFPVVKCLIKNGADYSKLGKDKVNTIIEELRSELEPHIELPPVLSNIVMHYCY
jgi:ankyrin repeat protein